MLPQDVREYLEKTLVENNFSGYELVAGALQEMGYSISKSGLHRWGKGLERQMAAVRASTEAARAIAAAAPDDADLRGSAIMSMVQSEMFDILVSLREVDEEEDPSARLKLMTRVAEGIATLSRATVNQRKWASEVRARAEAVAASVEKIASKGGLSTDSVEQIRQEILGIAT